MKCVAIAAGAPEACLQCTFHMVFRIELHTPTKLIPFQRFQRGAIPESHYEERQLSECTAPAQTDVSDFKVK